ncbi:hypothetical protein MUK42_13358 [Musa troglodytarum]|uniref:Uncharacterized protein n=1 Tax=Musa troglodytarum TaxID=320322 RepID=A0A9E7HKQ2_9LILI|nr:hypothetical protein MUK42_13358 [Musa troglodytarum]
MGLLLVAVDFLGTVWALQERRLSTVFHAATSVVGFLVVSLVYCLLVTRLMMVVGGQRRRWGSREGREMAGNEMKRNLLRCCSLLLLLLLLLLGFRPDGVTKG